MEEKLYFSPGEFPGSHSQAFQAAVDAAMEADVRVVAACGHWHLTESVKLPGGITVILDGATLECDGTAFETAAATRTLGGEQNKIFLLGRHGGALRSLGHGPLVRFSNCRDCRIADLTLIGGGIALDYFRYSKLQQLKILDAPNAVTFYEGCNNIIMENVYAQTREEALLLKIGAEPVFGRDPGFFNSIFCRLGFKTQGAAAVCIDAGIPIYNIVLRDMVQR